MIREPHPPDWYHPVTDMRTLILGTFPPHKDKRHFEFYYPNNQNRFWKVLAHVAGRTLAEKTGPRAVEERRALMTHLKVGVQNTGRIIERDGNSSLDKNIVIREYQDILGLIDSHPTLQVILMTGFSPPTSTFHSFTDYLALNGVEFARPAKIAAGESFMIQREQGRMIKCILGNSTSTAARRVRFEDLVAQFKRAILV